jgi:hypothetical protein
LLSNFSVPRRHRGGKVPTGCTASSAHGGSPGIATRPTTLAVEAARAISELALKNRALS